MSVALAEGPAAVSIPASIMEQLDKWVACHGNGSYVPADMQPQGVLDLAPDYGIQQVREEISELVHELHRRQLRGCALEIGLGFFGSTHFIWRHLFGRVITVEKSIERCREFARSYAAFSGGHWLGDDGHSAFIYGFSSEPRSVKMVYEAAGEQKLDFLFIDGDHTYQAVLCDWLLYHDLVRPGGIVAFHDAVTTDRYISEAPILIDRLRSGQIDGTRYDVRYIRHSEHVGIAYYEA